ncbi:MAG: dUTP diphosphatase [Planctomycetes bacterium]|nr:dUTP diphosphatase [Planctomycetota bacterium]MBM4080430.1 dUTP diphosphatase [Planctomycetota bacterium]
MEQVKVEIKRKPGCEDLPLPRYMSEGASGMDLHAAVDKPTSLARGEIKLIPTGIYIAVPLGYEAQVRPRSGLALKHGLTIVNAPGTIDSDYRGEVGVILANMGAETFTVERGMRIAQMVIQQVTRAELVEVEELSKTSRDAGGFGHTGRC